MREDNQLFPEPQGWSHPIQDHREGLGKELLPPPMPLPNISFKWGLPHPQGPGVGVQGGCETRSQEALSFKAGILFFLSSCVQMPGDGSEVIFVPRKLDLFKAFFFPASFTEANITAWLQGRTVPTEPEGF